MISKGQLADVIESGADVIRVNGLYKHRLWSTFPDMQPSVVWDSNGEPITYQQGAPVCSYGALYVAAGRTLPEYARREAVEAAGVAVITELGIWQSYYCGLADWSDDLNRTQEEVVEAFMRTAKRLRNTS